MNWLSHVQPRIIAELRDWVKTGDIHDTFQGKVFNDTSHKHRDGEFITLFADDVKWHEGSCLVYVGIEIYILWIGQKHIKKEHT